MAEEKTQEGEKEGEKAGGGAGREEDVITPEEFSKLEKQEESKMGLVEKVLHRHKKAKEEEAAKPPDEKAEAKLKTAPKTKADALAELGKKVDELTLNLEKLSGRLEAEKASREGINERLSTMQEEIGELRSMILDREKTFNEIEAGFQQMRDKVEDVDPARIRKEFDKKEKMIVDNSASIEKVKNLAETMAAELKEYRAQMAKVKSVDNLLEESKAMEEKLKKIRDAENYIDKTSAKVEKVFLEVKEKLPRISGQEARIDALESLSKDIMSNVNELTVRTGKVITRDDVRDEVEGVRTAMAKVADSVEALKKDLAELSPETRKRYHLEVMETLADVERKVAALEAEAGKLEKLEELRAELVSTVDENTVRLSQAVTKDELSRDMAKVEKVSGELANVNRAVAEVAGETARLKGMVLSLKAGAAAGKREVSSDLAGQISLLSRRLSGLDSEVRRLATELAGLKSRAAVVTAGEPAKMPEAEERAAARVEKHAEEGAERDVTARRAEDALRKVRAVAEAAAGPAHAGPLEAVEKTPEQARASLKRVKALAESLSTVS